MWFPVVFTRVERAVFAAQSLSLANDGFCRGIRPLAGFPVEFCVGGECQRVSIDRALLKDAPIVLSFVAAASLDIENETRIQSSISELIHHKTVLVFAHQMRTVANADKIVVLDNGIVAESDAPEMLLTAKGLFAGMVEKQIRGVHSGV
jgi:ATP-binding cassette subfamily B protein